MEVEANKIKSELAKVGICFLCGTLIFAYSCKTNSYVYVDLFYNIRIDSFDFTIEDTIKNGCLKIFDNKDSTLIHEGCYKKNLKKGKWIEYYYTGEIAFKLRYKNGKLEGKQRSYYLNGSPKILWLSKDGVVKKVIKYYDPEGKEITEKDFRHLNGL